MERMRIAAIFADQEALSGKEVTVCGWARTIRDMKTFGFIELNDGSCFKNLQVVMSADELANYKDIAAQNVGAADQKRAKKSMLTGIGVGLFFGCAVFALVMLKGDALAGIFSPDAEVVQKGFEYLKGFAPETILTAILFSMLGYFNGNNKTLWVMAQGLIQTLLVRLPFAYVMSIQPNASLTKIGLAAPVSTLVGVILNVGFYLYLDRKEKLRQRAD